MDLHKALNDHCTGLYIGNVKTVQPKLTWLRVVGMMKYLCVPYTYCLTVSPLIAIEDLHQHSPDGKNMKLFKLWNTIIMFISMWWRVNIFACIRYSKRGRGGWCAVIQGGECGESWNNGYTPAIMCTCLAHCMVYFETYFVCYNKSCAVIIWMIILCPNLWCSFYVLIGAPLRGETSKFLCSDSVHYRPLCVRDLV